MPISLIQKAISTKKYKFEVEATDIVFERFKRLLAMLAYNTSIGHSANFGMFADGDGADYLKVNGLDLAEYKKELKDFQAKYNSIEMAGEDGYYSLPLESRSKITKSDFVSNKPLPLTYKAETHTGAMIALFLPAEIGRKFDLIDPEALSPAEMHITLAYLGKADQLSYEQTEECHNFLSLIASGCSPLTGTINGCGRFCNGGDEGDPFFIIPDLPDLPALREAVIAGIRMFDIAPASDHGFTPHITLAYIPHNAPNPFDQIERIPVTFPTISLVLAGDRFDYPLRGGDITSKALIEKIGARHAHHEILQIQHIHDLTLELGAECHPIVRRAGARHSHADQSMVQRIHDDCAGLGAECKALKRDKLYFSQVMKETVTKGQLDAPNYKAASTPQRCKNCKFFRGDPGEDYCALFNCTADQDYVCDDWEAQRPDEIPGYIEGKSLAALTEGILILRGGRTSGNWGHAGRKGKRGGSGRGGGFKRIGVKPGANRKAVKRAAEKKQAKKATQTKPKKKVAKKAVSKPKLTPKPEVKPKKQPAKKPVAKPQPANDKKAKATITKARKTRDAELKEIAGLEREKIDLQTKLRKKQDILDTLDRMDSVDTKLKGRSSEKIWKKYTDETKADSDKLFTENLKGAKTTRDQLKKQEREDAKRIKSAQSNFKKADREAFKASKETSKLRKQFGVGDQRVTDALEREQAKISEFKRAKKDLDSAKTQSRENMLNLVSVSDPSSLKIRDDSSKAPKAQRQEWNNAMNDVNRLVSADVTIADHPIKFTTGGAKVRAHAEWGGNEIFIKSKERGRTVAHEVAHTIEMKNPRMLERAEAWRDRRTRGEKSEKLSKVTGNPNYRDSEVTKKDKFFSPYIGKSYKGASEVISMGVEAMYANPAKFAKDDPDMFDFIYSVLRSG
jgi:2'-5' RNA ligase